MEITMQNKQIDGFPVVDAKASLKLEVTRADCNAATRKDPGCCAVAKACGRELKIKGVRVHLSRLYLLVGKAWTRYIVDNSLRSELIAFDRGGKFQPGVYTFLPPPPSKVIGSKIKSGPRLTKGKPRTVRSYKSVKGVRAAAY
jgi:hypothetical protein